MKTKEEIEILRADAFAGDAGAQNDLGCAYSSGDGVIKNQKEAFMWFERSAKQGNKYGQYNTGRYYHYGISVKKDIKKAIEWYEKSALQNFGKAANMLGEIYENGYKPNMVDISLKREANIVITANPAEAFYWYSIGTYSDEQARFNLGRCFELSIGTEQNLRRACSLYKGCKSEEARKRIVNIREKYNPVLDTVLNNVELIGRNPFRILGVWSNSSAKDIRSNQSRIEVMSKVGQKPSFEVDNYIPFTILGNIELCKNKIKYTENSLHSSSGIWKSIHQNTINRENEILNDWEIAERSSQEWNDSPDRSEESISYALQNIVSDRDRVKYALFWFCKITPADVKAFQLLSEKKWKEALDVWKEEKNFSAIINRTVLMWIERQSSTAIANILEVIHNDEYRSHFVSSVTSGRIQFSKKELSRLFWDALYEFPTLELSFDEIHNLISFKHNIMLKGKIDDSEIEYNLNKQFDILNGPLELLMHSAKSVDKNDFEKSWLIYDKIAKNAPYELLRISRIVGKDNYKYKLRCNEIAGDLLEFAIHYNNNNTKDWSAASVALRFATSALNIAVDETLRNRCKENVDIFAKNKQIATTDKILEEIDKKFKEIDEKSVKLSQAEKLQTDISLYIECIKTENGKESDIYKNVSDNAVNAILNVIIAICNRDKDATTAISASSLLKKLKNMEMSSETRSRLERNLSIISNNMMAAISRGNYGNLGGKEPIHGKYNRYSSYTDTKEGCFKRRIHKIFATIFAAIIFAAMWYYMSWNDNLQYFMETMPWWGYICILFMILVALFPIIMWGLEFQENPYDTSFYWIDNSIEGLNNLSNDILKAGVQGRKTYSWPFAIPFQLLGIAIWILSFPIRGMAKLAAMIK